MSRCAILVTDRQLLPITTGNRLRILGILAALRALGWKVLLVGRPDIAPMARLRSLVDGFVAVKAPPFIGGDMARFDSGPYRHAVERLARKTNAAVVIAEYAWLAPALARLPRSTRRVIDCHDVLHERTVRFQAAGLDPWAVCTREQERRLLAVGDVILATQEREAAVFRSMLPRARVVCILTPIDLPPGFERRPSAGRIVLTVGSNHPGNEAVVEFARDVWPRVIERVPGARLRVVGTIASLLPALPGVENVGHVAELGGEYAGASVVVCPVIVGTGVKTKMLEALRFGKATVVTAEATEGMPRPERQSWVTAPALAGCADAIVGLLADPARRAALESAAFEFGEEHLAEGPFRARIAALLPAERTRGSRSSVRDRDKPATAPRVRPLGSVSVIVPSAGWPDTLPACLRSLAAQNVRLPVEIVVVVNGPGAAPENWPGVTIVREPRRGPAAARNAGVRASHGDVLAFTDADCIAAPGWLAAGLAALRRDDAASVIAGAITRSGARSTAVSLYDSVTFLQQEAYVKRSRALVTANLIVHRSVFERIGEFDLAFTDAAFEDWDWSLRAWRAGVRIRYAPAAAVDHPCMSGLDQLKAKLDRLALGEIVFRRKHHRPMRRPHLATMMREHAQRAWRETQLAAPDRVQLAAVGMLAGYWRWQAFERILRIEGRARPAPGRR